MRDIFIDVTLRLAQCRSVGVGRKNQAVTFTFHGFELEQISLVPEQLKKKKKVS